MDDYTPREITEEEISIETSDGKSIDAFDKEVVEELIVEELIEQGFSEDDVEDLSEIGAEMLLNEKDDESFEDGAPPPHLSTPKKSQEYHEKINEAKIEGKPSTSEEITASERLEATSEGLLEYAETIKSKLENYSETDLSREKYYYKHQLDKLESKISEIDEQLNNLSNDTKEIPIENYPEWQQDFVINERRTKQSRLEQIKDMAAAGIEMNGQFGMNALGEITEQQDKNIRMARIESEKAAGIYRAKDSNNNEPIENDPFEEYEEFNEF